MKVQLQVQIEIILRMKLIQFPNQLPSPPFIIRVLSGISDVCLTSSKHKQTVNC